MSILLICFTLASFLIQNSYGIRCYSCGDLLTQTSFDYCEDPFDEYGVGRTECAGSCTKSKFEQGDKRIVSRSCSNIRLEERCDQRDMQGYTTYDCSCNSDNCNLATTSAVSMTTILFMTASTIFYRIIL